MFRNRSASLLGSLFHCSFSLSKGLILIHLHCFGVEAEVFVICDKRTPKVKLINSFCLSSCFIKFPACEIAALCGIKTHFCHPSVINPEKQQKEKKQPNIVLPDARFFIARQYTCFIDNISLISK